jgi:hypothetical protein
VTLEAFHKSPTVADQAAPLISRFIEAERKWLQLIYPDLVEKYAMPIRARRNMLDLAESHQSQAYIVRGAGLRIVALGLARVVSSQNIVHPDLQEPVKGDRMGYLLATASTPEMHAAVVEQLCAKQEGRPAFMAVASSDPQALQKAAALQEFMVPVGDPASLTSTTPSDPFESGSPDGPAQIYQFAHSA